MVVTVIVIGVGHRGLGYSHYAKYRPHEMQVVAVADLRPVRAKQVQDLCGLSDSQVYSDWREIAAKGKLADAAIICTQDQQHKEPAVALAKLGYHILLEKPMATSEADCREIVEATQQSNVILAVCHVLKYTPQAVKIKELIESGAIGEVVNIQHLEPIGFWHYGHSYVRGNWRREDESSFCLLTKSCHDLDLISYWMGASKCVRVSSFGHLAHFNQQSKPKDAGDRCLNCKIEKQCPYSAVKVYLRNGLELGNTGWPVNVVADLPDIENVTKALETGPYGRCVYNCDNDVVTNQVVNMQFDGGQTASFNIVAFTESVCKREVKIHGTMGEITCTFGSPVRHTDFRTGKTEYHTPDAMACPPGLSGHGGADFHTIHSFIQAIKNNDPSLVSTGGAESLRSHLLVFAAERSRKENKVVSLDL